MKGSKIPEDIRMYILKRRIPYAIFFLALMAVVAFICISSEYIPPVGTVVGLVAAFFILHDLRGFKNNLFDKTWHGEIVKVTDIALEIPRRGSLLAYYAYRRYAKISAAFIMVTLKSGDKVFDKIISLPKNAPLNSIMDIYTPGSHILHIGGTKQYIVFKETNTSYICPVCGIENPTDASHCLDCGHTLIKNI